MPIGKQKSTEVVDLTQMTALEGSELVFTRLLDHLIYSQPLVSIRPSLANAIEVWRELMGSDEFSYGMFGLWGMIWTQINWASRTDGGPTCGVKALQFFGHLGEYYQRENLRCLPYEVMIPPLVDLQDDLCGPKLVEFEEKKGAWWVKPTRAGLETLHLRGRLKLSFDVPPFDIPQEYFEHIRDMPENFGLKS